MQAIFTLALVLNAWLSGGSSCVDAAANASTPVPAPASFPAAPVATSSDNDHTEVGLHASGRVASIGSARGAAPASIIARRNLDGDYSYQHPTLSAGRNGQAPPRKINT